MKTLALKSILETLAMDGAIRLDFQVLAPGRPDSGAYRNPAWGLGDPSHVGTVPMLAACAFLHILPASPLRGSHTLLERADLALDYLMRSQRASGRIDFKDCNFDSGPDTAFVVQMLCPVAEIGRAFAEASAEWLAFQEKLEAFLSSAAEGLLDGGFHTPNHRWVLASALVQAGALFPGFNFQEVLKSLLSEGIDIDGEGFYLERSIGVYDAVCDRSLLLLSDGWDFSEGRAAALANLDLDLHLLHSDATAETGLSRRQDLGVVEVPSNLAASYLYASVDKGKYTDGIFLRAAHWIWGKASRPGLSDMVWLSYVLWKFGNPPAPQGTSSLFPENFSRLYPFNRLWRMRQGKLSASLFGGTTHLFSLRFGNASLTSLKIAQSYLGTGRFLGDGLDALQNGAVLHSEGLGTPRRPGYELPLGRPVPREHWEASLASRRLRSLPPCRSRLEVIPVQDGFDLHYRTLDGLDRVPVQATFDFPPGGIWESEDCCLIPISDQVLFLRRGSGRMRYGSDTIEIGPGSDGHRIWNMRDSEPPRGLVRVLIAFMTPVDYVFHIRTGSSQG